MSKYEIVKIENVEVTLDLSIFHKTEELWFNATEIAKAFGKEVKDWLKYDETRDFFESLIRQYPYLLLNSKGDSQSLLRDPENRYSYIVKATRGRFGGTLLHKLCAFEFCRWCSKDFAVAMDKSLIEFIRKEQYRKMGRLEAKTGYRPLTDAIMEAHDPCKFYHYTNEADLLNFVITGKTAKKIREEFGVDNPRDIYSGQQLNALNNLQRANTVFIQMGYEYDIRKQMLEKLYRDKFSQEAIDNSESSILENRNTCLCQTVDYE